MSQLRVVLDTNVVLSSLLFRFGRLSQLRQSWQGSRDPKDQIFLDLAHSAQVNCLVTGDADLLVLDNPQQQAISFNICAPLNFLTRLETSL